jgi:nitroreductase
MAKKKTGQAKKTSIKKPPGVRKKALAKRVARAAAPGNAPTTVARIHENNRERRAIERAIDQQRDKTLTAYRAQLRKFAPRRAGAAKTIFAEGDSWFNYPLGAAVIDQLQDLIHTPIANFAWPGAETRQLLALHERQEIEKRLKDGPQPGKKWDVLLFSGGGDDIVGDQMVLFLGQGAYDPEHPEQVLNARFEEVLDLVMGAYQDLVKLRDHLSPQTLIVGHVYDYAWATGKGACWLGPWLRPSLDYASVPRGDAQHAVVTAMLERFETRLQAVAAATSNFVIVPTHGTLKTANEWANELHPKDHGFRQIARKFQTVLQDQFGADI